MKLQYKVWKNRWHFAQALFLFIAIYLSSLPALAQTKDFSTLKNEAREELQKKPIVECRNTLGKAYDLELVEFFKFLEINFQNKSANRSLSNIAIARYQEYKKNIRTLLSELTPQGEPGLNTEELLAYRDCQTMSQTYLDLAKKKLIEQVKTTHAQKKTTMLIEKYQSINSRLRDLHFAVAKMYGYFMTFKEKLPGFLQECIKAP